MMLTSTLAPERMPVAAAGSPAAYVRCLRDNPNFRLLWMGETLVNLGWWAHYIAAMQLAQALAGPRLTELAVSGVQLAKQLPPLAVFPACGVVADRLNRLVVARTLSLVLAAIIACLGLVAHWQQGPLWLFYALLALQYTGTAFYDAAHRAVLPATVPACQLHLATTLDSLSWSLTGLVGAALSGYVAALFGSATCFLLTSFTYLLAACCISLLPPALGVPGAVPPPLLVQGLKHKQSGVELAACAAAVGGSDGGQSRCSSALARPAQDVGLSAAQDEEGAGLLDPNSGARHAGDVEAGMAAGEAGGSSRCSSAGASWASEAEKVSLAAEEWEEKTAAATDAYVGGFEPGGAASLRSAVASSVAALRAGAAAAWEGGRYMCSAGNREVAAIVCMQACGALLWATADVINVRLAELPGMQRWGGPQVTLGLIMNAVASGCLAGPLLLNMVVAPAPVPLAWGVAAAFGLISAGFALMHLANGIALVLLSTLVRELGSEPLTIFSTMLLQLRVPNAMLGRMLALEAALHTLAEAAGTLAAGAAFDVLGLSLRQALACLTAVSAAMAGLWAAFAATRPRAVHVLPVF